VPPLIPRRGRTFGQRPGLGALPGGGRWHWRGSPAPGGRIAQVVPDPRDDLCSAATPPDSRSNPTAGTFTPRGDSNSCSSFPQQFPPPPGGAGQGPRAGAAPAATCPRPATQPARFSWDGAGENPVFLAQARRTTEGRREYQEGGSSTKAAKTEAKNGLKVTVSDGQERYFALIGDLNGLHQALVDSFDALACASQAAHDLAETLGFALVPADPEAIAALQEEARQLAGPPGGAA